MPDLRVRFFIITAFFARYGGSRGGKSEGRKRDQYAAKRKKQL